MSHINVTINGRQYRMACEEGQEVRLLKLAENLEMRVGELRGKFGEIGDARLTVMAALTACDELLDANARIRALEGNWRPCATCSRRRRRSAPRRHAGRGRQRAHSAADRFGKSIHAGGALKRTIGGVASRSG
jgi:cell division protein ZapA